MASPGGLITAVAEALGTPEVTVFQHDRNLVAAGIRPKGGRGRSAKKSTCADAAFLLTAVLGAEQVKESVQAVNRYRATRLFESSWSGFGASELSSLPPDHNFVDALEALITSALSGSLDDCWVAAAESAYGVKTPMLPALRVTVQTPLPIGDIALFGASGFARRVRYALKYPEEQDTKKLMSIIDDIHRELAITDRHDLTQYREITGTTIFSICTLLRS